MEKDATLSAMDKIKVAVMSLLAIAMPSLIVHLGIFTLLGFIFELIKSNYTEPVFSFVLGFLACSFTFSLAMTVLKQFISIFSSLGGVMMLLSKIGIFIGTIYMLIGTFCFSEKSANWKRTMQPWRKWLHRVH